MSNLTQKQIEQLNQLLNANYIKRQELKEILDLTQSLFNEVLRNICLNYFDENCKIIKQGQHLQDFQELHFFDFIKTKLDFLMKQQKKIQKNKK